MNPLLEFKIISKHRMVNHYYPKLCTALNYLEEDQLWSREAGEANSIGGIVIHIVEHIRRNTQRMLTPEIRYETGIESTFTDLDISRNELLALLESTFREFEQVIHQTAAVNMYDIYHLVEHTGYHLGQIIDRTQRMTGRSFQFVQQGINEKALQQLIKQDTYDEDR
ncbi:DinB family protein [Paenibacillus shenyangensis]|uniref:DUF1572 family protein n=2 Tax=Paenibacillus TaxID=44249 RepID=UPI00035E164C|nr:DUF1572 family protein [Paenibacillus sp. A9]